MREMKRILAFLLSVVMLVSLLPAGALGVRAAGSSEPIYVLAGGDFQQAGDHTKSAENVTNILNQIARKYDTMDGFLFVGDYDCETHGDATESKNGVNALMNAVQSQYSDINHDNSILTQGNHDAMVEGIDATGGYDMEGYAVYAINEDNFPDGGGSQTGVQAEAKNLEAWLNDKLGAGYDAPIFVMCHVPLAFSPRTNVVGDGKYGMLIFDVLNTAAENGLNIIFMHGHDHAYGNDNYLGGEAIYLKKGDKINIAEIGSTTKWTEETLNFTYMNAGYTGYYSEWNYVTDEGTDQLTMTVFKIEDNQVTVERYSANGVYNLKSAGRNGRYVRGSSEASADSLGLAYNTTVYSSPQIITLSANNNNATGTIGQWVGVTLDSTDDVTTPNEGWMEITAPVPGTAATPTTYKYVLDTNGVNAGEKYLILNTSSNGSGYALTNNNGSAGRTQVDISNKEIIVEDKTNIEWTVSGSSSGTISNQNRYISPGNNSLSLSTSTTTLTISNRNNGAYRISRRSGNTYYYLRYSSNKWNGSKSSGDVYLFVYDSEIPGTPATSDKNGIYGMIAGDPTYNATAGMTAEQAMAGLMGQIDGYLYESMSKPGTDVTGTKVEDSQLTWAWVDTFDGSTPGDYAVEISYNGVKLGTAEVVVPAATVYYAAEGNGMYYVHMNTTAEDAMKTVQAGVTVYTATDANGTGKTAISDDDVTWKWLDKYDGANVGPYTVEILKNGTSLGTVEVKVNVKYETGINADWTYIGEQEATGGSYVYTLDTDGIDYGEEHKYIIVDDNEAIALHANSTSNGTAQSITISGNTATTTTRDYEYHVLSGFELNGTSYHKITKGDGSQYLYQEGNGVRYGTRDSVKFAVEHMGNGLYRIRDIDGTQWCVVYNGSWTVLNTTNHPERVRFYKYTGTTGGTGGGPIYAKIEGKTVYYVANGSSATKAMETVKEGITGYISSNAEGTNATELADNKLTWTWKNKFSGSVDGSYWVEISYDGKSLGTVQVIVEPGVVDNYPEYPKEGAIKVDKTATGVDFQSSGIAQVEISASGVPSKKGADVIVMLDTSSSMAYCLNCKNSSGEATRHDNYICNNGGQTRAQALEATLTNLVTQFNTPGADGQPLDIRMAVADFNGFNGYGGTGGTPYDRDEADNMEDNSKYTASNQGQVYTGTGELGAGAFVPAEDLKDKTFDLNYASGTNYDYAMDAIYQMGTAVKSEDRDLFVIFMSDGAAMQWNYYHSQGASNLWENWITGKWKEADLTSTNLNCTDHSYYYDLYDHDDDGRINEHRMANAIKGDPSVRYEIIRKSTAGIEDIESGSNTNLYTVPGLGAKMFAIAFDPMTDTNVEAEHMVESISTLASDQTGTTKYFYDVSSADALAGAFNAIGSEIAYAAYNARFVDKVGGNFNLQMTPSTYTVLNADKTTTEKTIIPDIQIISYDIYQKSQIGTEVNGVTVTEDMVGRRIGTSSILETVKFSYTVEDGTDATGASIKVYKLTGAYSNLMDVDKDGISGWTVDGNGTVTYDAGDNILGNGVNSYEKGVINAKTFLYNTTDKGVALESVSIPTGINADNTTSGSTNVLPSETFYWKMGTIQTTELAMRYYVYLDGSMEGTKAAGSYQTNEFATLYYDNNLSNPCYKETVSPVVAWKSAKVSYAFYLVNDKGEVIVNQTTGATGTFANKIALTQPVVYEEILLNNLDNVSSLEVRAISDDVLPDYYTLYDETAKYTVVVRSNTTGSWNIVYDPTIDGDGDGVADGTQSTYVTDFNLKDSSDYTNEVTTESSDNDYTHTTVWFAVKWAIQAHPDTVVVDYGLPVNISVMSNDMFGDNGHLEGVGAYSQGIENIVAGETIAAGFSAVYTGTYGTAQVDITSGTVRYTPTTMDWKSVGNGYEKFAYAVNYTGTTNPGYYYDTVTVIPATTVYYEDNFTTADGGSYITYGKYNDADNTEVTPGWQAEGEAKKNAAQAEDRPGRFSLSGMDANNVYGYDGAYSTMNTYSMGSAMMVHVDAATYATAEFSFYGTGLDIISMTTSDTGLLIMQIFDASGKLVKDGNGQYSSYTVDTYFGYKYENGQWVVDEEADGTLYQVPILKAEGLPYGKYQVKLIASYIEYFDHTAADGYDLYLDAIRIYDPAGTEYGAGDGNNVIASEIQDAYITDGEGWPAYHELRDYIIKAEDFDAATSGTQEGVIFIDNTADDPYDNVVGSNPYTIEDYTNYGPNNELYLAKDQSVAFELDLSPYIVDKTDKNGEVYKENIVADVQIGIKSADGNTAVAYLKVHSAVTQVSKTAATSTSMYYSIRDMLDLGTDIAEENQDAKTIIILQNNGDSSIMSITDIKITLKEAAPAAADAASLFTWNRETGERALTMLCAALAEDIYVPEETVPETTIPEAAGPEATEPEAAKPESNKPEVTEPETTEPESAEPEVNKPQDNGSQDNGSQDNGSQDNEPEDAESEVIEPGNATQDEQESGTSLLDRILQAIIWLFDWLFGWLFR